MQNDYFSFRKTTVFLIGNNNKNKILSHYYTKRHERMYKSTINIAFQHSILHLQNFCRRLSFRNFLRTMSIEMRTWATLSFVGKFVENIIKKGKSVVGEIGTLFICNIHI